MKRLILLTLILSQLIPAIARQKDSDRPYLTKSFDGTSIKNVKAETSGGSLTVTGSSEKEAKVEVYVRTNGNNRNISDEEIKKLLSENYDIDIAVSGDELRAIASSKGNINWKKSLSISFRIFVPSKISSKLHTSVGSIRLSDLSGNHDFSTSGGSLHIEGLSGMLSGKTSGGSIYVANSKGTVDLKTSGGSIEAVKCNGTIDLSTSGGSLKLEQLQGNIKARTSGGSISGNSISGELFSHTSGGSIRLEQLACSLDASTSAGGVTASFTTPGKFVKINVSAGSATLALPKNKGFNLDLNGGRINAGTLNNFNGIVEKDKIKGSLNGGGTDVYVRTSAGSVSIDWR